MSGQSPDMTARRSFPYTPAAMPPSPVRSPALHAVEARLIAQAVGSDEGEAIVTEFCEGLVAAGLPLWRFSLSVPAIDPCFAASASRGDAVGRCRCFRRRPRAGGREELFRLSDRVAEGASP